MTMPSELVEAVQLDADRAEKMWASLTASQRGRVEKRFRALLLWNDGRGETNVAEAAEAAGVSVSRFYRIAAEWRKSRSFESLGVFAGSIERRSKIAPEVAASLSEAAREAVMMFGGASTSELVARTVRMARLPAGVRLPGMTKLREIVTAEVRRATAYAPLGQTILFDCVATSLPRFDRRPHLAFLCIDGGTGMVLGSATGDIEAPANGYAQAANNAVQAIDTAMGDWRWSNVFSLMRVTAGQDLDPLARTMRMLNVMFLATHFILERDDKRYGRLIAQTIGPRLGRIAFTPTRTLAGDALATNGDMTPWTEEEAERELRRATDAHNQSILSKGLQGSKEMPANLYAALVTIGGVASQH